MESELVELTRKSKEGSLNGISKRDKFFLKIVLVILLVLGYAIVSMAQTNLHDINYVATSSFVPTIKDAIKFTDIPEIKDTVKKIDNIKYGINSNPMFPKYQVQTIDPAKMQNEPLTKLYNSLLKVGYGPLYNMPYGEFWIANKRDREQNYGAHIKHFSSTAHLQDVGYGGFSDNVASVFGKRFYKKHTLTGDFNYERNVIHYYGFDTTINKINDKEYTKQRYQLFEPKVRLQSHYTDSTHTNHDIGLSFYNLQNLNRVSENNIKLSGLASMFLNKEKLNLGLNADYYNHKQSKDTVNNLILSLSPSFEARGKKWQADLGLVATIDNLQDTTHIYFYPKLNVQYDIFESMIIPYAGINGGLIKNSLRSLSSENPFIDTNLNYVNTHNKYNFYLGLKGNLSSNTSYDAKVSYGQYNNLHYYAIDYTTSNQMFNSFNIIYDNTAIINVCGQLNYRMREKLNLIAKGNYYVYTPKNLTRAYHKPDFDMTFSAIYNLQSKLIFKADVFVMGSQWAFSQDNNDKTVLYTKEIKGWADASLEAEYRYSKMLSFFARANNVANQRYYRWERYPSQKFNFMIGLTFVPF